jgi:hypothetical protein
VGQLDTAREARVGGALIGAHMRKPSWHALDAALFLVSLAIVGAGS